MSSHFDPNDQSRRSQEQRKQQQEQIRKQQEQFRKQQEQFMQEQFKRAAQRKKKKEEEEKQKKIESSIEYARRNQNHAPSEISPRMPSTTTTLPQKRPSFLGKSILIFIIIIAVAFACVFLLSLI